MLRRLFALLLVLLLACPLAFAEEDDIEIEDILEYLPAESGPKLTVDSDGVPIMTITCTGDFTIGDNAKSSKKIFARALEDHEGSVNFTMKNMKDILSSDELTLVNFEGTLTDTTYVPSNKKNNDFLFSISPSYVSVLTENSIEAVSLENNHVMDHGDEGYDDTKNALDEAGVIWSNSEHMGVFEFQGVKVAMLSYLCIDRYGKPFGGYDTFEEKVCADIAEADKYYPLVIVSFHWGVEKDYSPTDNQIRLGRMAVDSGADLVIGHHSHRIQPIEYYKGVYICYSLGNFCFSGNSKPDDMSSIVFQIRYRVKDNVPTYLDFRIIPIRISSRKDVNDFTPTPFAPESTEATFIVNVLKDRSNTKKLDYAVMDYPLTFN